jgi:diguanylate cyclase (GGDEF)-like protein
MSLEESRTAVWADYVHPDDVDVFDEAHEGAHVTGRLDVEYRLVGADGRVRWVRDRGRMRLEGGRRFLDGSVLEVTAFKRAELALERARAHAHRLASIDPLTGVFNRRSLRARLDAASTGPVGVLSVDIDHFKHVNDLYGHAAGDAVLVAVAARLRAAVRQDDAVFRMGGEEFLVLLPALPDETALADIAESVRLRMAAEPVLAAGRSWPSPSPWGRPGRTRCRPSPRRCWPRPTARSTPPSAAGATASASPRRMPRGTRRSSPRATRCGWRRPWRGSPAAPSACPTTT